MQSNPPKLFISYSHDDKQHKDWVLRLATRLVGNGVDVVLDQWNLSLGGDLPRFMEKGLTDAMRVIAVCTEPYVHKANEGKGGVGYEKMILTGQLMANISSDRIIPLVRSNVQKPPTPTFLTSRVYIDFNDDDDYEAKYEELIRDIYGMQIKARPTLGLNPFAVVPSTVSPTVSFDSGRYVSPANSGFVTFDYSNNNGRFVVGSGDKAFETAWSSASSRSIHAYKDAPSIRSIALAIGVENIRDIKDAREFDSSSRTRKPSVREIVLWENSAGYFLATQIERIKHRGHGDDKDELSFSYIIAPSKQTSFVG